MKRCILFLLMLQLYLQCQAININGTYMNEYGNKIVISDSMLIYIEKQSHLPIWYNDTLAVCRVKTINPHLFEINSLDNCVILDKVIESNESSPFRKNDSIKILFECPYTQKDLKLSVETDRGAYFNKNGEKYIYIPRRVNQYIISAWKEPVITHTVIGQAFGTIKFVSKPFHVGDNGDILLIISFLDNGFFERYCITGEYIYHKKNKLYWKGNVYKKDDVKRR